MPHFRTRIGPVAAKLDLHVQPQRVGVFHRDLHGVVDDRATGTRG
jgi:hypothetical protein